MLKVLFVMNHHVPDLELGRHLRSVVDACLEEGQYESALSILEQLCTENYKPYPPYVRQLICMALYPSEFSADSSYNSGPDLQASPSKFARQSRAPILPSPHAASMAQRILISYAVTNTPESIFRALPGYHQQAECQHNDEDTDSLIADEALSIKQCKTCWEILQENFGSKNQQNSKNVKGRSSRKTLDDPNTTENTPPVSSTAEAVLQWLILLFEKDEKQHGLSNGSFYSPFLLQQIPPPRGDHGSRWETDPSLDLAFYCVRQSDSRLHGLGARLLRLMINLSATTQIDFQMLVNGVHSRLLHLLRLPSNTLDDLWPHLGANQVMLRFKVALCLKYVADRNGQLLQRNKLQVRGTRTARPIRASDRGQESQNTSRTTANRHQATIPIPTGADILYVLSAQPLDTVDDIYPRLKYELILAFYALQHTLPEQDQTWNIEEVMKCAKESFTGENNKKYLQVIHHMVV